MRSKNFTLVLGLITAFSFLMPSLFGQSFSTYQIITVNGGKYEFNPPYADFVTVQSTDPVSLLTTLQGTVFTQSVQDVMVNGATYFVSAGDSIVKFDGNTHQRLAATRVSGANKLGIWQDYLLVSRQYPVTDSFLYVLSTHDLSFVKAFPEISGESAGILCTGGRAFVAVNYGWAGTSGKIAVIDLTTLAFLSEVDLNSEGTGVYNLFQNGNQILTVNRTPWGGTSGYISTYTPLTGQVKHYLIDHVLGAGYGIFKNQLFLNIDGNIGTVDLDSYTLTNPSLIVNPVASVFGSITSAAIDTFENKIYFNAGDFFSFGQGYVYTTQGDSIGVFTSGISAEAVAIDIRSATGINSLPNQELNLYPNPFSSFLHVNSEIPVQKIEVYLLTGEKLLSEEILGEFRITLNTSRLRSGIYLLKIYFENGSSVTRKIIKR
ncbi:MAG: T9SS type A sorting domain-containing protein [Bacteroidales bacterium]